MPESPPNTTQKRPRGRPRKIPPEPPPPTPLELAQAADWQPTQQRFSPGAQLSIPLDVPVRLRHRIITDCQRDTAVTVRFRKSDVDKIDAIAKQLGTTRPAAVREYFMAMLELVNAGLVSPPLREDHRDAIARGEVAPGDPWPPPKPPPEPLPEKRGPGRPRKHPVGQAPKRKHRKKPGPGRPKLTLRQKCLREAAARRAKIAAENAWMEQDHVFGND